MIRATSSGDFLVYASDDIFAIVNNTLASRVIVLIKKLKVVDVSVGMKIASVRRRQKVSIRFDSAI